MMCQRPLPLSLQLDLTTQQKISKGILSPEQLALKKKNDLRALSLLKALAQYQVTASSPDLSQYPALSKAIAESKANK